MTARDMLEQRHETWLQWCEPWPACGPEGNDLDAGVVLKATVHNCVNLSRAAAKAAGRLTAGDDEDYLLDFIAIHWATVVEATPRSSSVTPPYLVEDVSVGEILRWINRRHLNEARADPPDAEAMARLQDMGESLESTVALYLANDRP
jgi:hypothetical protein